MGWEAGWQCPALIAEEETRGPVGEGPPSWRGELETTNLEPLARWWAWGSGFPQGICCFQ